MDPVEVLPPEIILRVLELLDPPDLCRCLAVSKLWRYHADTNNLWKRFCCLRHIEPHSPQNSTTIASEDCFELKKWSRAYIDHMNQLTKNWLSGTFKSLQLAKLDWFCCLASFNSRFAIYYPRISTVCLYSLELSLDLIHTIEVPPVHGIPDLFINEHYIVLCRGNVVLIYDNGGDFALRKVIVANDIGLIVNGHIPGPFVQNGRRVYVKVITKDVVWLESDTVYVVDMTANSYRVLSDTFRCLRTDGTAILAANSVVSVYNMFGEKLTHFDIGCVVDMWLSEEILVVLIGSEKQRVEIWDRSNKAFIGSFKVAKDPCIAIGPRSKVLFVLEFDDDVLWLSAVSIESGEPLWNFSHSFDREMSLHPELRLICDRFLFVRPSYSTDKNFLLLRSSNGTLLTDASMPPSLFPPSYIYHFSDEAIITAESNTVHLRRYV